MRVVDLFCGAGGFSLGLQQAGHTIVAGLDVKLETLAVHNANFRTAKLSRGLVPEHELPAFCRLRPGGHRADLKSLLEWIPVIGTFRPDVIVGGPPCQPWSPSGKRLSDADPSAILTVAFATITAAVQPQYFVMENVPQLSGSETYKKAISVLRRAGYGLTIRPLNARDYGSVQNRKRLIVAGCRGETDGWLDEHLDAARVNEVRTVQDVLGASFGPLLFRKGRYQGDRRSFFRTDEDCPTIASGFLRGNVADYVLRPSDIKVLETIEEEIPFLARRNAPPYAGLRIPAGRLPIVTLDQAALLAGFPSDYNWRPIFRQVSSSDSSRLLRPRPPTKTETIQMIGNSVSPPLAKALGDCLARHRTGIGSVDRPPQFFEDDVELFAWLREQKGFDSERVEETRRLLGRARGLVAPRELTDTEDELRAFDLLAASRLALRRDPELPAMREAMVLAYEFTLCMVGRRLPEDTTFDEYFEALRELEPDLEDEAA